ncbi:MAG: NAD(P)-dependent oxidoreductase [Planctomycetota bacterium]|jgi:nucleoside-diphosphate-sugar epimerase|nr:NAD(P)-dependent oxidoreductase [Planctomycetota bacterium]
MRIVVTGAAGAVGRYVCTAVEAAGHELIASDRRALRDGPPLQIIDLRDRCSVFRLLEGAEAVIHLGNHPRPWGIDPIDLFTDNAAMNINVFHAAHELGVQRIAFASSIQVIGGGTFTEQPTSALPYLPIDGDVPPNPGNGYAASKVAAEALLASYARRCPDRSYVAIRLPGVRPEGGWRGQGRRRRTEPHPQSMRDEAFSILAGEDAGSVMLAAATVAPNGYHCYQPAARCTSLELSLAEIQRNWYPTVALRGDPEQWDCPADLAPLARDLNWEPQHLPFTNPTEATTTS